MPSAPRPKHIPLRTCVACRDTSAKRQLVRVVRQPNGTVKVDPTGKANGRGAYLCARRACWEKALKHALLDRALKTSLSAEDQALLAAHAAHYADDPA